MKVWEKIVEVSRIFDSYNSILYEYLALDSCIEGDTMSEYNEYFPATKIAEKICCDMQWCDSRKCIENFLNTEIEEWQNESI